MLRTVSDQDFTKKKLNINETFIFGNSHLPIEFSGSTTGYF